MGLINTGVGIAGAIGVIHAVSKAVEKHESNKGSARAPVYSDERAHRNDLLNPIELYFRRDQQHSPDIFGPPRNDSRGYAAQSYPALEYHPQDYQGGHTTQRYPALEYHPQDNQGRYSSRQPFYAPPPVSSAVEEKQK